MISEEEVNLLQQENQALREKADLLQEKSHLLQQTVSSQEKTIRRKNLDNFDRDKVDDRSDEWNGYIATLREQHRNLPALRDELAKAKL